MQKFLESKNLLINLIYSIIEVCRAVNFLRLSVKILISKI